MVREARLILIALNDIIFWSFIVFDRFQPAVSVPGCITILKEPKAKMSICTSFQTNFTRIPDKFPEYVAELIIENQNIATLDSSQLNHLPYLVNLTLKNSGTSRIVQNSFHHVPQLISLRLSGNQIYLKDSSMPRSALIYLKNLQSLDLSRNPLGSVPDYYFQLLKQLKFLNMSGAERGFYINANGFYGLKNLQILDLTNNNFVTLSESLGQSFSSMQLQEFYLYQNPWNCDCNLQWLKTWFSRHKLVRYSRDLNRDNSLNGFNIISDLQPKCAAPSQLMEKNLLSDSTNDDSIRTTDLKCPPKIFTHDRSFEIAKHQNITFICDFHANPGGSITWSKNGMVVKNHWHRVSWNRSQGIKFRAWLILENVEENDSGSWRCTLTTQVGTVNSTFSLKVIALPSTINLKSILKYVGIGAVTLILLLVVIGIIVYCVYGFQINNNNRPKKLSANVLVEAKETPVKQSHTNYHILSKTGNEMGFHNKIMMSSLDKGQYYNPTLMESNTTYIQPCLEQTHSPFSHYLVNGSSTTCPLHGKMIQQKSSKLDDVDGDEKDANLSMSVTDSNRAQSSATPCPIHGDMMTYFSGPAPSITTTCTSFHSPCLSSSVNRKPKEYIVKFNTPNQTSTVTTTSLSKDINYLSSSPDGTTFSFSTAI